MVNFSFFSSIPQPDDNPTDSQTQILQNFTAIGSSTGPGSWTTQDHYGFGTGSDGQHKQITFAGNFVPTSPTSPPVLFTNNDAFSIPQLFYYTGTANQSANQYVASNNGSTMLMGGIVLKWGFNNGASPVTFAPAFPHACFNVQITSYATPVQFDVTGSLATTGFTFSPAVPVGAGFFWMAIGN